MLGYIWRRNKRFRDTMPELPEVETTRRGVAPCVIGRRIVRLHVYDPRLRWPVPADLAKRLDGRTIDGVIAAASTCSFASAMERCWCISA